MKTIEYIQAEEAVQVIKSGDRVFLHGSAATPVPLITAMQQRHASLQDVELVSISNMGDLNFDDPQYRKSFFMNSLFVSANTRAVVNSERGDYVPVFLSQIPQLFKEKILPLQVALIQVSEPDAHGYCSLGCSVDIARAAVDTAKHIIAIISEATVISNPSSRGTPLTFPPSPTIICLNARSFISITRRHLI